MLLALAFSPADRAPAAVTAVGPGGVALVDGEPAFLLGLADPPPLGGLTPAGTDGLDEVVAGGIRLFRVAPPGNELWSSEQLPRALGWLDAASTRGALVWLSVRELGLAQPGDEREALLRLLAPTLAAHPGLGFWRGMNEPWWAGIPAESLAHANATVKELDSSHAWLTIQAPKGTIADLAPYSAVTDFHGVDVYPVRLARKDPDLHAVGRWTETIRRATPNRAVFMTLQICFAGAWNGSTYILPTRVQERFMIYDAIVHGARGLVFYGGHDRCWSERDLALGWNWTFWDGVLEGLLRELAPGTALNGALAGSTVGLGLRASDPQIGLLSRRTDRAVWVIVTRHGKGTKEIRIRGLPGGLAAGRMYPAGNRRVPVVRGSFTTRISRWGVQVIRFPIKRP